MANKNTGSGKSLLIVESPSKVKTIAGYLGEAYEVDSSLGHIRDLPQPSELPTEMKKGPYGRFAVDVDSGFEPYYVVNPDKKKKVTELKRKLKECDAVYLATDGDREGEAIAWHLFEVLKPKVPVYRITFPEITREAIERAFGEVRDLDLDLVDAQETRRVLDRLYGYEISPVLWRKVSSGLSAGRVQSVATRMVVQRERERMAFVTADYWDLNGEFTCTSGPDAGSSFGARLVTVDGKKVAGGKDFNDDGALKKPGSVVHLGEAEATSLAEGLAEATFTVVSQETKPYVSRPKAPFTTSTLQQDAARKLHFSSRSTMQVAQRLYENGYITYMRTDSVALSTQAVTAARRQVKELWGADYVPDSPRSYASKSKNAQEAHEAIRPAGDSFRTPDQVRRSLSADEFKLYELIWQRTVASQMADAKGFTATVRLGATATDGRAAEFTASGTVITFPGFLSAYQEAQDSTKDSDGESGSGKGAGKDGKDGKGSNKRLPQLEEGQGVDAAQITADGHSTRPPARYTEASLVAAMDEMGIGRPSTYAAVISTIVDRGYVKVRGTALIPSWTAFSVVRLLEEHFSDYVDYDFTAEMEEGLDRISRGEEDRQEWLQRFYFGETGTENGLKPIVDDLGDIDARALNSIKLTDEVTLRVGKYGPYLETAGAVDEETGEVTDPVRANVPESLAPDELTPDKVAELMEIGRADGRELGSDPQTGRTIVVKDGRYGPYVSEVIPEPTQEELDAIPTEYYKNGNPKPKKIEKPKPRTASLFQSMDMQQLSLEEALKLLSLPREVGADKDGEMITSQNGRYGPYLKKGSDSRSLTSEDQIFGITLEEAQRIYALPKQRGRGAAKPPLKDLGTDPITERPMIIKEGRFGEYITDGETNVTVPRSETVEQMTPERASQLLSEKRAKGPAPKKSGGRAASSRSKSTAGTRAGAKSGAKSGTRQKTGTTTRKRSSTAAAK